MTVNYETIYSLDSFLYTVHFYGVLKVLNKKVCMEEVAGCKLNLCLLLIAWSHSHALSISFHDQALQLTLRICLVCSQCDKLRIGNCSVHGSLKWVKEPTDVLEKEGLTKARSTIPSNMDLKISSIPGTCKM